MIALDLVKRHAPNSGSDNATVGSRSQAEAVAEAIFRHQDLGETGKITFLGQLLQLVTIYDNMGRNADLIHPDTKVEIVDAFSRLGWSQCFAATIREENGHNLVSLPIQCDIRRL